MKVIAKEVECKLGADSRSFEIWIKEPVQFIARVSMPADSLIMTATNIAFFCGLAEAYVSVHFDEFQPLEAQVEQS